MIKFTHKGNFDDTNKLLFKLHSKTFFNRLEEYGQKGVNALKSLTPVNTGKTANSWSYEIIKSSNYVSIVWKNSNVNQNGTPIAILLQYGHGTSNGGYVQGKDYINPAIKPIFDEIEKGVWQEIVR